VYKISHLISKPLLKNLPETLGGGLLFMPPTYDRNMQPAYDRMQAACVPSVTPA